MAGGVTKNVEESFRRREQDVLALIRSYHLQFLEVGIFGSYARNEYKTMSDIDFCIVTNTRPAREISGSLREEAELLGADIIFVTPSYFAEDTSALETMYDVIEQTNQFRENYALEHTEFSRCFI